MKTELKELLKPEKNINNSERMHSAFSGVALLASGINSMKSKTTLGVAKSLLGTYLLYRGLSGYCPLNKAIGRDSSSEE